VELKGRTNLWSLDDTLNELDYLARTAGAEVVGRITQRANRLTSLFLGKGKIQEVKERAVEWEADTVIFDDELTPSQQRNLEEALGTKVIDRTALILDVFARHARTYEGQLQVELAQHKYLLPRLAGQWSHLERLGGGIGTPGARVELNVVAFAATTADDYRHEGIEGREREHDGHGFHAVNECE